MADLPALDQRSISHEVARDLTRLIARTALIIFVVEALIMFVLSGFDLKANAVLEGLGDATSLAVISSPLIYLWVARPYAVAARLARHKLALQLAETRNLLDQNEGLRRALQDANESTADTHERILQKISAELHDGPAQLLSFALIKLDRLGGAIARSNEEGARADLTKLRDAIHEAMREVRDISTGLALPELGTATLREAVELAVRRHEDFTTSRVKLQIGETPAATSMAQKACAYRFVQEALSNSYRHSGASHRAVKVDGAGEIAISVTDNGSGFDPTSLTGSGLGLPGMRARIEALGGRLLIESEGAARGSAVTAKIPLKT